MTAEQNDWLHQHRQWEVAQTGTSYDAMGALSRDGRIVMIDRSRPVAPAGTVLVGCKPVKLASHTSMEPSLSTANRIFVPITTMGLTAHGLGLLDVARPVLWVILALSATQLAAGIVIVLHKLD